MTFSPVLDQEVDVVDMSHPDAPARFTDSLRRTGFAVLTGHPVPPMLLDGLYAEWLAWFEAGGDPACDFDPVRQDGHCRIDVSETAKGHRWKDLKEFYHLYPWGRYPVGLSDAALRYRALAEALAAQLLDWVQAHSPPEVAAGYSMPLPAMIEGSTQHLLRVLHYPPLRGDEAPGALRAAAHEDINLLTVLPAATETGLQVRGLDGQWRDIPCDHGMLVINTGDMLQEASGGWFPSTTHRVVNPSGPDRFKSRMSLPLFLHPRPEVRLSDRHSAASYLNERLVELGLKSA